MPSSPTHSKPTNSTRFKPGQSGNPKGRPKSGPKFIASAYDIIVDRKITITKDGVPREATVEEALQLKTYQLALDGKPAAQREVLKMIEVWSKARAAKQKQPGSNIRIAVGPVEPVNAFEALLLLDIAIRDPNWHDHEKDLRLVLQPWAVDMARKRLQRAQSRKTTHKPAAHYWRGSKPTTSSDRFHNE